MYRESFRVGDIHPPLNAEGRACESVGRLVFAGSHAPFSGKAAGK